jgi:hypothetical protein
MRLEGTGRREGWTVVVRLKRLEWMDGSREGWFGLVEKLRGSTGRLEVVRCAGSNGGGKRLERS